MKKDRDIIVITVIILQTLMMVIMNNVISVSNDIHAVKTLLPFFEVIVFLLAILSITSIRNIEENAKETIKSSLMKSNLQQVETLLKVLRTEKHEISRHLQTLQALIYLDKNPEAIQYIEGITENRWNADLIEYAGHPVIAGLLNSKANLAQSQGIEFAVSSICQFPNLNIEPWDFCSILGNVIDNAMEAALQDKVCPRVGVEFKNEGGNNTIYVHNNGKTINKEAQDKIFAAGFTDKNSPGRGYGLFIAKTLVDRYGGEIECRTNKTTTFVVKLPEKEQ